MSYRLLYKVRTGVGDNDKKFRCIWPSREDNDSWILWKIFNKVMDSEWRDDERHYFNKKIHPNLFWRVHKNNNQGNTFERGWLPKLFIIMNCISRDDMTWHNTNKHTALLSRKVSEYGDGKVFYDPGVPALVYNSVFDDVVSYAGDYQKYDVVIKRMKEKPYYKIFHGVDDYNKFGSEMPNFDRDLAGTPLTEEELNWERYDIDKFFPITAYSKIQKRLKIFIAQVDEIFGTHYSEELDSLVEEEKKNRPVDTEEDQQEDSAPTVHNTVEEEEEEVKETPVTEAKEQPVKEREPKNREKKSSLDMEKLKFYSKLNEKEIDSIIGWDEKKGSLTYKEGSGDIYKCSNKDDGCTMETPEFFHVCPLCGEEF